MKSSVIKGTGLLFAVAVLCLPSRSQALDPPHNASNHIDCNSCHAVVPAFIPLRQRQESACKTCHNPTGQASTRSTALRNHVVNGGSKIVDCGSCHDPHGPSITTDPHTGRRATNLWLIRWDTAKYVAGALEPAIFHERPAHFAFGDANPPWNGACQTCHAQTSHHRNDATSDHSHQLGDDCTQCHLHGSGFLPAGGGGDCTGCHSGPQDNGDGVPPGGRRAVVSEFPTGDEGLHAHYGAELGSDDCVICHSQDTHMDGYVDLIDPDDGSMYRFKLRGDLLSDPDLSDFCAHCHDADGAARLATPLDPFGNGNAPPDVATRFQGTLRWDEWYGDFCFGEEGTLRQVNSHHDISDSDQAWSGAKIECLSCHGAHNPSAARPVVDPFDTATPWTGKDNGFCLSCHAGGNGPADPDFPAGVVGPAVPLRGLDTCYYTGGPWWVDYTWTHAAHGLDSKRAWSGYSGAPGYELPCLGCHDPHGSYTPANPAGNPYMIRDFVDGTQFVDDGTRTGGFTGPPWNTFGTSGPVVVTISGTDVDWGSSQSLCGRCHASWLAAYDWHAYCTGCQTCHGHGQAWGNADWVGFDDDTPCPVGGSGIAGGTGSGRLLFDRKNPPIHFGAQ